MLYNCYFNCFNKLYSIICITVNEYILLSKEKYGYNSEQALGMLYWHHHDMEKALSDLANFAPLPDDWTTEDKVTFESAFNSIGKNFLRIKQMVCSILYLIKMNFTINK